MLRPLWYARSESLRPLVIPSCNTLLCTPTGGKARIVAGCAVRPKK